MKISIKSIQSPRVLLSVAIILRCVVFVFLSPDNNDAHITIVDYLARHGGFPSITGNYLAFHPPLYYWMAAPIFSLFRSEKAVQALSLITSIATIIVLYRLIYTKKLIATPRVQLYCFLLAGFLPQFVMFSLYLSNDSLSFLLGSMVVLAAMAYIEDPAWKRVAALAVVTGLGLLTKSSFLAIVPVLLILVYFVQFRECGSIVKAMKIAAVFLVISSILGSYKYVDNYVRYRRPFISSLDLPVWSFQMTSYRGLSSYVDCNIFRILKSPSIPYREVMGLASPIVTGSYPLLLYGTFWYQMIPESNFRGDTVKPFSYIGSVIYCFALIPTACFMLGSLILLWRLPAFIASFDRRSPDDRRMMIVYVASAMVVASLALIVTEVVRYHVWSLMQGRYLFPSFAGLAAVFAVGAEMLGDTRVGTVVLKVSMIALLGLFCLYYSSEIGYLMLYKCDPGIKAVVKRIV